jgi:hypothetical protein
MRRGETNAMIVSGDTGQTASRPANGSRMIEEAKVEGGAVRPAGTNDDSRQAHSAAVDKAFAAVIIDQQLADRLLRAVRGLRRQRRFVADRGRQRAAIDRERAREHHPWAGLERAAGIEHRAGAFEIDAVAEIGVGFGLAADHGR